jgi:hypothetical protein
MPITGADPREIWGENMSRIKLPSKVVQAAIDAYEKAPGVMQFTAMEQALLTGIRDLRSTGKLTDILNRLEAEDARRQK